MSLSRGLRSSAALCVGLAVATALGACGSGSAGSSTETDLLGDIKSAGVLRVGVAVAPPMTIQQADGTMSGPNLIPLRHLAEQLGVQVQTVPTTWGNIVSGLVSDKYDFAANLDKTEERERAISFTDAVYMPHGVFVVLDNSAEHTATDIFAAELPIATSQGSAHEAKIVELGGKTLPIDTYPNAVQAVKAKRAVAEFTDLPTAEAQVQADPSLKIVVPDPLIYQATANYGVRKDTDQRSLEAVNAAIAETEAAMVDALADVGYMDIGELGAMQKVAK